MKIGDVARLAGVRTSRIRFYEAEGLLPRIDRSENGYRDYDARILKFIAFIERAQRLGFSLKEIACFLSPAEGPGPSPATFLPLLRAKLVDVDRHLVEARGRRREIKALLTELDAAPQRGDIPHDAD